MQAIINFHNTTNLGGQELVKAILVNSKQDANILQIFEQSGTALSPSMVLKYCQIKGFNYLLTSVRRTINTLTRSGKLSHTGEYVISPFGRPEGLWEIIK